MDRSGLAWRIGAAHLALAVLLQLEDAAHLAAAGGGAVPSAWKLAAELPFLQLQNLAVAGGLALVAWLCGGRRWLRPLPHLLLAMANCLLVADQLSFKVFLTHVDLTPGDAPWSSLAALRSSAWAAAGWTAAANVAALVALSAWAARGAAGLPAWLRSRRAWWAAAWAVCAAVVSVVAEAHQLQAHPLFSLVASLRDAVPDAAGAGAAPQVPLADLYLPRSGAVPAPAGEDAALLRVLARLRRLSRPNVLLVVLESVGAKQMLPFGALSAKLTPGLAARARGGVAFTAVYAPFPGTTRSHVALETGGADIAGSDFDAAVQADFAAPDAARAFAGMGYRAAVFSAGYLGPQKLGEMLQHQGYPLLFDPEQQARPWRTAHEVSSWGVDERVVCQRLLAWTAAAGAQPWFAQLLTVSTHHPYAAPGVPAQLGDQRRYEATLGYTDTVLAELLQDLERSGQLARTVVVVCGDHGEAFARWHMLNFTHRNYLYEENVRSFLMVLPPPDSSSAGDAVVSQRVATMGDVLPTVLAALGRRLAGVPGQSLWPDAYSPRIVYFSKSTQPAQWGLRDGRLKFIARTGSDQRVELYDLPADPDEQTNLAAGRLDLAQLYDRLCAHWFASASADFRARLAPRKDL